MNPLLRRIAINGVIAAVILAMFGLVLAEAASFLFVQSDGGRSPQLNTPEGADTTVTDLRYRLPLSLAVWGVILVVLTEVILQFWRRRRPAIPPNAAAQPQTDADRLLAELLKAEAAKTSPPGTRPGGEGTNGDRTALTPTPPPEPKA